MANIRKIEGKTGTSYRITVSEGRDISGRQVRHYKTYTPAPGTAQRLVSKELNRLAIEFEKAIEQGLTVDSNIKFAVYAERWLAMNEKRFAPITYARYKSLLVRINQGLGQ
ncbi:MAG: hypothetical protein FWE32_04910 [Oscillospiraceae bacterium]|nr:hypothetical protein [Oscillospiraceae bacterium]